MLTKLWNDNYNNDWKWVLAHEYAHILQYKKGFEYDETKWNELQADFLAGWAITTGLIHSCKSWKTKEKIYLGLADLFYSLGDTGFGSKGHHGTPKQRELALINGVSFANKEGGIHSLNNAWKASVKYIDKQ